MATEQFAVVALPHSCAEGAAFHVSLFVSPALVPDGGAGTLADFTLFPDWARTLLENATFELLDDHGAIAATPLLDPLAPEVWAAAFPPDTPVRGRALPPWQGRRWRTFRAGYLHDAGKLLHLMAMFTDPTSPTAPSAHPLRAPLLQLLGQLDVPTGQRGRRSYDESMVTRRLDALLGEGRDTAAAEPLASLERRLDATADPWLRFALELHRARRFYERPESALAYRDRPLEGAQHVRPPRPEPDFHERCTLAGDHPSLLRRLGLVVDLRVDNPARLRTSAWLSARIVAAGDTQACRLTRTRCEDVGTDLVTVAATPDWSQGRLRLGDPERFQLLDMDADGTALKLDRFVWTLPRLLAVEANGDPIHAAPTALRSLGFTVVRHRRAQTSVARLGQQAALQAALTAGNPPLLATEDVSRGLRVEVWDDTAGRWSSLHDRRIDVAVLGHGTVLADEREQGFIQGTAATETVGVANSPVHVHDAAFGWSGWSLSAPRPGKRVRHDPGAADPSREVVEDPDASPDPVTPIVVTSRVQPGTLPRLRYGRSYAFRAWAVDLAGNVRPHTLGTALAAGATLTSTVGSALAGAVSPIAHLAAPARTAALAALTGMPPAPAPASAVGPTELFADPTLNRAVLARIRERRAASAPGATVAGAARAAIVARSFATALADTAVPLVAETAVADAARVAAALAAADLVVSDGPSVVQALALVTALRPFLRWDPVAPPAVVTRHRFTAGESLRHLVVRSGVAQDLDTLEITLTDPATYAAAHAVQHYRATSERHLAPPKTSQVEAELHGLFDEAIGSSDPAVHRTLAAVALREAGTFFDMSVRRLDDPAQSDPQPGISLQHDAAVPAVDPKTLPLALGEAPAPGQYIAHDTDQLVLPYLPDALGRGISLVFQDAGGDRQLPFPFGVEGFTARYGGAWPARQPFRLVLEGGDTLAGRLAGHVLHMVLPPGDLQRFRLSSCFDRADLDLFGLWRSLPPAIRNDAEVAEAAADGWLWALSPFDDVALVHAVPRPVEAPRPTILLPVRVEGSVETILFGAVDVHGPSTDSLTLQARWIDPVDDLTLPAPEDRETRGVAFTTPIRPGEDLALLGAADAPLTVPGVGPVSIHKAVHGFGDTRHRIVHYRFRAASRFREYFEAAALEPVAPSGPTEEDPDRPVDDGRSVVGPLVTVSVPSSARPAAPVVHSTLPLFRWDESTEPEQPVAVRRRRRAGVRIYLERPWYSSGADELLGVLLAPGGVDSDAMTWVSQWGGDPVWHAAPVTKRAMFMELDDLLHASGLDDRPADARPVRPPSTLPLTALSGAPPVVVLGYRPAFNLERGLWYVDVAIDPASTFWPFLRLAVARYQPDSIPGCHLSAPVRCDFVQLTPERTTSVSRTDLRHVRVVVSGPVGARTPPGTVVLGNQTIPEPFAGFAQRIAAHRTVVARLQRRDPQIPTDLGWQTVAATELTIRGHGHTDWEAAWVGALEAPEELPLQRPGDNADWRVTVEEWERLPGDPPSLAPGSAGLPPVWEQRLIYADEVLL